MVKLTTKQSVSSELRRTMLKRIGAAVGVSAASIVTNTSIGAAAAFYEKGATINNSSTAFSRDALLTLRSICETVIPRTDTPSAADVNCHEFIAHQLSTCHSLSEVRNVQQLITQIDQVSRATAGQPYIALNSEQQTEMLEALEDHKGFDQTTAHHFSFLKGLIIFGYFTSEAGATKALNYQMVPGGYKGSIPVTPETKAWGSLDYY